MHFPSPLSRRLVSRQFFPWLFLAYLPASVQAHVHGEARLEIGLAGNTLELRLKVPQEALLGFERAPQSAAEREAWRVLQARLANPTALFSLPAAADCQAANGPEPEHLRPLSAGDGHRDLILAYRWHCRQPERLRALDSQLFSEFPRLQRIRVDFAGPNGQKSGRLSARQARFTW